VIEGARERKREKEREREREREKEMNADNFKKFWKQEAERIKIFYLLFSFLSLCLSLWR
jgi:hypothetical protein